MQQQQDQSGLKSIAEGGAMVFGGIISSTFLVFVLTALIARHVNQEGFGFFTLGLVIVKNLALLSGLGFSQGLPRYISYQLGKKEYRKAWSSIASSFVITFILSPIFAFLLYLNADLISQALDKPGLAGTIKIMAFTIPFMALIELLVSYLRAVREMKGRVYFQYVLRPFTGIILVLAVILCRFSYTWVLWAYTISFFITLIVLFFYAKRKLHESFPIAKYSAVTREIVLFSLPLLGAVILSQILMSTDTLLLGYFESAQSVGLYGSASRIAQLIPIISTSAGFIYLPVVSQLFSQNKIEEITTIYAMITKWTFIITLPLFLLIFFAPDLVLHLSFGTNYTAGSLPLRILAIGFFLHVLFGLNGMTCISLGKGAIFFSCQFITLVVNLILNFLLIPKYGTVGASIASCISLALTNALITVSVYRYSTIHPFSRGYLRIIFFAIAICPIISLLPIRHYLNSSIFHSAILILFFIIISLVGVLVTKNLSEEDASLIGYIEERIAKNTRLTDRFVRPFIRH